MTEIPLKIEEEESLKMEVDDIEKVNVGLPGKSAYEIAKEAGFSGTKEEWLASLKGESDDKKSMDREFFRMLPKGGTAIRTEGTDINSIEFTKVGNYYCSLDLTASTFKNTPTTRSFMMFVLSPLSPVYDNEETTQWCYRIRIMVTYTGEFFVQSCSSGSEAGKFDFGKWKKIILEEV